MQFIDTHTHLYLEQFDEDRYQAIQRAKKERVELFLLPNIDSTTHGRMWELCNAEPACKPMMGLHPCSVKTNYKEELAFVERELRKGTYVAVGEIGIDLYWDKTFLKEQQESLARQIAWAKEMNLPVVIHARESYNEIFEVLDELNSAELKGVFHCFTGTLQQAEHIVNYGDFYLGIGGVLTFKNGGLDKIISQLPTESLILETDSPYLAPTPYRGKRNESTYIPIIAQKLADLLEMSLEQIAEITTANAKRLFKI